MNASTIETTRARLNQFKGRFPEICDRSGLGYSWLSKFSRAKRGKRPGFDQITKLTQVLDELEAEARVDEAAPPSQ